VYVAVGGGENHVRAISRLNAELEERREEREKKWVVN
jgi:benzoyl-CoA reductase/2-hydroxyglutaryl-CoA dehydratase subunit BcrC/BadD/HgdB